MAAIVALVIVLTKYFNVQKYLSFESLKHNKTILRDWVDANMLFSVAAYIVIYIFVAGLSLPGATVLTLAGGFLYGTVPAVLFVNIGATMGAFLAFLAARYLLGTVIQEKYPQKMAKFNADFEKSGHNYLLSMRFIPAFPFFMINIFAGLTKVPARTFLWTTAVGIIPGSAVYAFAGSQLDRLESPRDIMSPNIFLAFTLLGLFSVMPVMIKCYKRRGLPPQE